MTKAEIKEIFVTYSWDGDEHNDQVLAFTNHLRKNGFNAEMDKLFTQNESSTDFFKMMHQAMTDYNKVIIVLSKGYKTKAEQFKGGVGNEYSLVIKDIETNKNKYILVSFEPITDSITPLNFKGRHIFDLSDPLNYNELYAKLQDVKTIEFADVAKDKPKIKKKIIPNFQESSKALEIGELISTFNGSSQNSNLFTKIDYLLSLELINNSTEVVSDYSIEVTYPAMNSSNEREITLDNNEKIFPSQKKKIDLENFLIKNNNAGHFLKSMITIKLFTEKGLIEKEFQVSDILKVKNAYGTHDLTEEMFHDKNYR